MAVDSILDQSGPYETGLSFDEALTLHHRVVFGTARADVRDTALAEEIPQEVFLKLHRHFDSKPSEELFSSRYDNGSSPIDRVAVSSLEVMK